MAGKSASNNITRYAGLQVQTSALGLNVPVGWGTFRCKCNLVDYLDFKSQAHKSSAGKGGSTTTGYSYSATIVMALCEGPIDSILAVYVNSKVYVKLGSKTALQQVGLSLATGAVGQPVWSYLTSHHPTHAIGYSGLAIAYAANYPLDSGATPPNHSFEVVRTSSFGVPGTKDADPSLVVADFFNNGRYGVPSWTSGLLGDLTQYQDYCLAAGLLVSPAIDSQRSASDFVNEILKATNATCVWSEGVLKFIPYGDTPLTGNGKTFTPNITPVYLLDDDDFVVEKGSDPVQVDIADQSDAYNVIQLEYLDRSNQYNMAIALASDAANVAQYGMRRKDPDTVHCICDPKIAALSAQLYLQRTLYVRGKYKFKLGWMFALLEPGDLLEISDSGLGLVAYPVRIIQIDESETGEYEITAEDAQIGVAHAPLYTMQETAGTVVDKAVDPGGVEANLALWSDDRTRSAYSPNNVTIGRGGANDQYGFATADTVVPTAVNGGHAIQQALGANIFAGVPYTFSVCIQAGAHTKAIVRIGDGQGNGAGLNVDLSAGAIVSTFNDGTLLNTILLGSSISPTLVSGIWQVTLTVHFESFVVGTNVLNSQVEVPDGSYNSQWTGDGSNALYVSQWQVTQGIAVGTYAATTTTAAGPIILAPPPGLAGGQSMYAAVAGGPNWGGANVWASIDGTSYEEVGVITAPARFGRLTAAYASHADPDTADTLSVDLGWSGGSLTSASSTAAVDQGATTAWIGPAGELVSFETATLTNPCRYSLGTYIRRGFMNTPVASHSAGDLFVRMDQAVFAFPYLDVNTGQTVYIKFQSFNAFGQATRDLADCIAYSIIPNPAVANAPGAGAWTAVAASLSAGGVVVPVIEISGAIDNPSATAIHTYYRITGATLWTSDRAYAPTMTQAFTSSVVSGAQYDVAISYTVGDVETALTQIGAGLTMATAIAPEVLNQGTLATLNSLSLGSSYLSGFGALAAANVADWATEVTGVAKPQDYATASKVYKQMTAPSGAGIDDIWIQTDSSGAGQVVYAWNGASWISGGDITALNTAAAIAGQAPAATDHTIQAGATKNVTTYAGSAPSSPTDGDIWVDTATNPNITYLRASGSWQVAANYVTGTSQLVDTAALGQTAVWATVSGTGKPADNATKNVTTYGSSAPSSPTDGDIWVDTGVTPTVTYLRTGGAWQIAANHVTDTSQVTDGANLGGTAAWIGVASKPANVAALGGSEVINNATLQAALAAGTGFTGQGALSLKNTVGTGDINAGAVDAGRLASGAVRYSTVHVGLQLSQASAGRTTVTITADNVTCVDASMNSVYTGALSNTLTITASGLDGLDTGSLTASTWYYIWIISNGTVVHSLCSLSATAPTMPGGYTFKARVGSFRTDGSSKVVPYIQNGHDAQYVNTGAGLPVMATGIVGTYPTPDYAVAVGPFVPATAAAIAIIARGFGTYCATAAPNANYGGPADATSPCPLYSGWAAGSSSTYGVDTATFFLESGNIYVQLANTVSHIYCLGWTDSF